MMKVLFLQRDPFVKFGISILSGALKDRGHHTDLLVEGLEKDIVKKALELSADIIAFSITTSEYAWAKQIGRRLRKDFGKLMICGGPHPTFYPEFINEDYLDAICLGEGEGAIIDLVDALDKGNDITGIRNMFIKQDGRVYKNELRPLIDDLDCVPLADRAIYEKYPFFRNQRNGFILTGRGCPYQCAFCFNKLYNQMYEGKGAIVRRRRSEEVIKEIKRLLEDNPNISYINFLDDTFVLSAEWLREFLGRYRKEIGAPFSCTVRANLVNEEQVKMLKDAKCFSVRLGLESADDHLRNVVLKKGITVRQVMQACAIIKRHGLRMQVYNILGAPGETLDTALESFELNKKIRPTHAWCSLLQPYPGTETFEYAVKNDYLPRDYTLADLESSYFISTPIKMEKKKEICNLQKLFSLGVLLGFPKALMKLLIKLPFSGAYEALFKLNYAIGIARVDNINPLQLARTALLSRGYFRRVDSK